MRYRNVPADRDGDRQCLRCFDWKNLSSFQRVHGYHSRICRACAALRLLPYQRAWRKTEKGKICMRRSNKRQRQRWSRERRHRAYLRRLGEMMRAHKRRYKKSAKGRASDQVYKAKRRARTVGDLAPADWQRLCDLWGTCAYCNEPLDRPTMDHVIPLASGGPHNLSNVVPACKPCNSRKGTSVWTPWIPLRLRFDPQLYRAAAAAAIAAKAGIPPTDPRRFRLILAS